MAGTDVMSHVKAMLLPTVVTYGITLVTFGVLGAMQYHGGDADMSRVIEFSNALNAANGGVFNINPILLLPPVIVIVAVAMKIPAIPGITLGIVAGAVLGVIFTKVVLPEFVWFIGEPSSKTQAVLVGVLVAFITIDLLATAYCFYRMEQRALGIPPQNAVDVYVDSHFNNDFIQDRFQNLVVGSQLAPNA